jgi:hypothetical protein
MSCQQGNQIGRIFAYWASVYIEQFLEITEIAQFFGLLFARYT